MCDLMRIQIYFIMRFDLYASELTHLDKLSDIIEHMGYPCILVQTLSVFS